MSAPTLAIFLVGAAVVLWVAYKIGQVLLRLALGLLVLGLIAYGIWHFLIR